MRFLLALLLALPGIAIAAPATLVIPGQDWQISFDSPPLTKLEESDKPDQYMYFGNSGRFDLSLYVETPSCSGGDTHKAFYQCYWKKASRNPMIVKSSVTATEGPRYYKLAYDVEAALPGGVVKQRNINFLIAYHGKWTDLHVSVVTPTADDLALLDAFEKSLVYGEAAPSATPPGTASTDTPAAARPTFDEVKAKGDQQENNLGASTGTYYMALGNIVLPAMVACHQEAKLDSDPGFTLVFAVNAEGHVVDSWQKGESEIANCFKGKMAGAFLFVPPEAPFYSVHEIGPTKK